MGIDSITSSYGTLTSLNAGTQNQLAQARTRQLDTQNDTQRQTQTEQSRQTQQATQTQEAQQTQASQLAQRAATVNESDAASNARLEADRNRPTVNTNGQTVGTRINTVA